MTLRLISLVPSITETLLAWGIVPAGVTKYCEAPGVPTVGGTKNPDISAILRADPDLVLMDVEENRLEDADALRAAGLAVHATRVRNVADVEPTLISLAEAIGAPQRHIDNPFLDEKPYSRPGETAPRAWIPIWRRPWMSISAATYGSSLLAAAGIVNVCAAAVDPYPALTLTEAVDLRPDVVLAPSEPYPWKERHRAELEAVAPVVFVDGQDVFWWGSRSPAAFGRLRELAATLVRR